MSRAYRYEGAELDVFAEAVNWKAYWSGRVARFVYGDVLEIGAGIGANTSLFAGHRFTSWTCVEPDAALAARIVLPPGGRHRSVVGTLASLDARDRFHSILYIDVLEHIACDAEELRRASRHLHPGGHLVVLSPACPFLYSEFDAAVGHCRRYTKRSLRAASSGLGLTETAMFHLDAAGVLASAGNRILLRDALPTAGQIRFWDRTLVPLSRILDRIFREHVGKTIVGVWQQVEASHDG